MLIPYIVHWNKYFTKLTKSVNTFLSPTMHLHHSFSHSKRFDPNNGHIKGYYLGPLMLKYNPTLIRFFSDVQTMLLDSPTPYNKGCERKPSRQFWDRRRWKSGLSIVIWDCGRWKSGPCLLGITGHMIQIYSVAQCDTIPSVAAMFFITTYHKFSNKRTRCYDKPSRIHPSCRGHSSVKNKAPSTHCTVSVFIGGGAFIGELRYFLHKPIVYGVMCLLYGVALSGSVHE